MKRTTILLGTLLGLYLATSQKKDPLGVNPCRSEDEIGTLNGFWRFNHPLFLFTSTFLANNSLGYEKLP